jgi:hypothetical protein
VAQVVEHLPSKHKALNSNSTTSKKKKKRKKKKKDQFFRYRKKHLETTATPLLRIKKKEAKIMC